MYAVFEDGARQYRVQEGDVVKIDFREAKVGSTVEFNRVLIAQRDNATRIGEPVIAGARVLAEVVDHPSVKLYVQHFRRRKNDRRLRGDRHPYTAVRISKIDVPDLTSAEPRSPSRGFTQQASTQYGTTISADRDELDEPAVRRAIVRGFASAALEAYWQHLAAKNTTSN